MSVEFDVSESFCGVVHLAIRTSWGYTGWQTACTGAAIHTGRADAEITCPTCAEDHREEVAGEPVMVRTIEQLVQSGVVDIHDVMLLAGAPPRD